MAAAALCEVTGGLSAWVENAAGLSIAHILGSTCDPVSKAVVDSISSLTVSPGTRHADREKNDAMWGGASMQKTSTTSASVSACMGRSRLGSACWSRSNPSKVRSGLVGASA